jgi:predicted permease
VSGVVIRLLLRLYPSRLRREYGDEMRELLEARFERARLQGWAAVAAEWTRSGADLIGTCWDEWRASAGRRGTFGGGTLLMNTWIQDGRHAVRRLVRTPVFTVGALAIMAIAIGANTAAFAVINGMLLAPPPFDRPEEVVSIYQDSDDGEPSSTSFPAYRDMAATDGIFAAVAATSPDRASLQVGEGAQPVAIEYTTASMMAVIGRNVTRGRWFYPEMDVPGAGAFAVVSHHAWVDRFGSDPSIGGRTVRLNNQPVTVIGVGPEGFNGVGGFLVTDFWLSISSTHIGGPFRVANLDRREDHWYDVKARLAPGVTPDQSQQAMTALALELAESFPELNQGRRITVFEFGDVRLHPEMDRALFGAAGVLGVIVLLVLVLASTNLGSLLLVRGISRTSEVAVRQALGAGSGRVARLFLSETLILSMAGGLLGIALARWLLGLLALIPLPGPMAGDLDLSMDWRVLAFSVGLMLGTGLFFGWAPALQSLRTDVAGTLREDGRSQGRGRSRSLLRNGMVAIQVAVSLILVVGAGVMARSLARYATVDPGFDVDRIAVLRTSFGQANVPPEERGPLVDDIRQRLAGLPGVTGVSLSTRIPVQGGGSTTTVVEGYEPQSGTSSVELNWAAVSPGYFATLGIDLVEGRGYTEDDRFSDLRTIVVNETAARRFWPGQDPIGRRIRSQNAPDSWRQVMGVVQDSKVRSLGEPPTPMLYYVLGDGVPNSIYFVVRTARDPASLLGALRSELRTVNPSLPVVELTTAEGHLGAALAVPRVSASLLGVFSMLALLLASVGIYTIVSFAVAGRLPEIGIRVALGAARTRVVRLVVGEVAGTVAVGLALGGAVVMAVGLRFGSALSGVNVLDPMTLLASILVLGGVVGLASYLPARRAARVDPVNAMRG